MSAIGAVVSFPEVIVEDGLILFVEAIQNFSDLFFSWAIADEADGL